MSRLSRFFKSPEAQVVTGPLVAVSVGAAFSIVSFVVARRTGLSLHTSLAVFDYSVFPAAVASTFLCLRSGPAMDAIGNRIEARKARHQRTHHGPAPGP